jgi:hypothetical protein
MEEYMFMQVPLNSFHTLDDDNDGVLDSNEKATCAGQVAFTLKNIDKRVSTLKSLPPKKGTKGTVKSAAITIENSDSD